MSDNSEQSRHVSYEQVKSIIDFMGQHIEFALGNLRSLEARNTSKRLWNELTNVLNNCRGGTQKTTDGWSKYWSDFKNKLKNKAWLLKSKKTGISLKSIRPLTKLEKRALVMLGPYFGTRKSREEYTETKQDPLPPKIKVEAIQEVVKSDYNQAQSESSDRLSDGEDRSNSNESSGGEDLDDNESNDLILQNLYPKWLIEVEKKRADAELIRAKAEKRKAVVAARNSEAALLQAEALKRLADAASVQAEAILRIATALEARVQGDMLAI